MSDCFLSGTFPHKGREFLYELRYDNEYGPPWDNDCGTGEVTKWVNRKKRPGERVLDKNRESYLFYDVQETQRRALKEGWGLGPDDLEKVALEHGYPFGAMLTKREIAAAAVERDFARLKGWCDNDWYYIGVVVKLYDPETEEADDSCEESCWGIESDGDYWKEIREDLANQLLARVKEEVDA